jgi:RND family efflux transporter MFP subunit
MRAFFVLFVVVSGLFGDGLMGIIKPIYEAKISVATDGIVSKIIKQEGTKVKKGDTIIRLDDKLQALDTKRKKIILDDKIKLNSMKESVEILSKILDSKQDLYDKTKSISLNELNNIKMQFIGAKAEYNTTIKDEEKEKIDYQIAIKLLDYYRVKSPVDGIVTKIEPKIGEWVQSGTQVAYIVNTEICFVEIDIDAKTLDRLSVGSKVDVEVEVNNKLIKKEGKVVFISAVADSSSGLIRTKVNFDNKKDKVTPGLQAKIIF